MVGRSRQGSNDPEEITYFYDFIVLVEQKYAWASVACISEEIDRARALGPALAGLEIRPGGVFVLKAPIGFGHFAFVELEFDADGILQPVMGGFIRS